MNEIRVIAAAMILIGVWCDLEAAERQQGASNRNHQLIVSEIMYHPNLTTNESDLEFIEIYNAFPADYDVSGWRISGKVDHVFPQGTILPGHGYYVLAANSSAFQAEYGKAPDAQWDLGTLSNGKGTIRIRNRSDDVLYEVEYEDGGLWPTEADGLGHSLVLFKPDLSEGNPLAWGASHAKGGSPGAIDIPVGDGLDEVTINEVCPNDGGTSWVEFHNAGASAANIGNCKFLNSTYNAAAPVSFMIPANTSVPAGGYVTVTVTSSGVAPKEGTKLYLQAASHGRILDTLKYRALKQGESFGRYPDGSDTLSSFSSKTKGSRNTTADKRQDAIVITEINYNNLNEAASEFIELYNKSGSSVDISGWHIRGDVSFDIPAGTSIGAGKYLVIAEDAAYMIATYSNLNANNVIGDYNNKLSNSMGAIRVLEPAYTDATTGDISYRLVDEVIYEDWWDQWSDGEGCTLELLNPDMDNSIAENWKASDESGKAPWTHVAYTNNVGLLGYQYTDYEVQMILLDKGQALVDNVVVKIDGQNALPDGSFSNGIGAWEPKGSHRYSEVVSGGVSGNALRLHALTKGNTGPNGVESDLTKAYEASPSYSEIIFEADVRWERGARDFIMQAVCTDVGVHAKIEIPDDPGTPGEINSVGDLNKNSSWDNVGPVIANMQQSPILPSANEDVVVTATISDAESIQSVELFYRVDALSPLLFSKVSMVDNGAGQDAVSGDGIYTGVLPGQSSQKLVQFYVQAKDSAGQTRAYPDINEQNIEPALTFFDDQDRNSKSIDTTRIWITKKMLNAWTNEVTLSNYDFPVTMVYNENRIVHNAGFRARGSGWTRQGPATVAPDSTQGFSYKLKLPHGRGLLNSRTFNIDNLGEGTCQRERLCFWIAEQLKVASLHPRYMHVYVNGHRKGTICTDAQKANGNMLASRFPDYKEGALHYLDGYVTVNDTPKGGGAMLTDLRAKAYFIKRLDRNGNYNMQIYRWAFEKRNGDKQDYTELLQLIETIWNDANFSQNIENAIDLDSMLGAVAVRKIVGDGDGFGWKFPKNSFIYKPKGGRWSVIVWDLDYGLGMYGGGRAFPATTDVFAFEETKMEGLYRILTDPVSQRAYWRALKTAVDGPLLEANYLPYFNSLRDALTNDGVSTQDIDGDTGGGKTAIRAYITTRRNGILQKFVDEGMNVSFSPSGHTIAGTVATITGTAPVEVKTIRYNGVKVPLTFTDTTTFEMEFAIPSGAGNYTFQAYDIFGEPISGMTFTTNLDPANPEPAVQISEILAHTDSPYSDTIELYNPTSSEADIGNWILSDQSGDEFTIPAGTKIPATSYLIIKEDDDGNPVNGYPANGDYFGNAFRLSSQGDEIKLSSYNSQGFFTGHRVTAKFEATKNGVSQGRIETTDGVVYHSALETRTLGAANAASLTAGAANSAPVIGPLVITEFLPMPAAGLPEFIEIANISSSTVNLYDDTNISGKSNPNNTYKVEGIGFEFPVNVSMVANEVIILTDATESEFRTAYSSTPSGVKIFSYSGGIKSTGERLKIKFPDAEDVDPVDGSITVPYIVMDDVDYADIKSPSWPIALTNEAVARVSTSSYGNEPTHWTLQGPTPGVIGAPTTPLISTSYSTISATMDLGATLASRQLEIWNVGAGTLNYTITESDPDHIITVSPTSGSSTGSVDKKAHTINFTSGLAKGTYSAILTIADASAGLSSTVTVTVNVQDPVYSGTLNTTTAASLYAAEPDTAKGNTGLVSIKMGGMSYTRYVMLRFDASSLLNADVSDATLNLNIKHDDASNQITSAIHAFVVPDGNAGQNWMGGSSGITYNQIISTGLISDLGTGLPGSYGQLIPVGKTGPVNYGYNGWITLTDSRIADQLDADTDGMITILLAQELGYNLFVRDPLTATLDYTAQGSTGGDPSVDSDGDGYINFLEDAFGMNPNVKDAWNALSPRAGGFDYEVRNVTSGYTYKIQTTDDLSSGSWTTIQTLNTANGPTTIQIGTSESKKYIRTEVSK